MSSVTSTPTNHTEYSGQKETFLPAPEKGYTGYIEHEHEHDYGGDTKFGFWVYILSDCILFACLFAVFAVLQGNFADAPTFKDLFQLDFVLAGTMLLLVSSFTFGMAMLAANKSDIKGLIRWLFISFALGFGFLAMEMYEFVHFTHEGASPWSSGAWAGFYGLIGTHGLHVLIGMIWLVVLVVHIKRDGLNKSNSARLVCLSMFWHFLDVIWICVFTVVYLMGVI